jgi:hypothetical protein
LASQQNQLQVGGRSQQEMLDQMSQELRRWYASRKALINALVAAFTFALSDDSNDLSEAFLVFILGLKEPLSVYRECCLFLIKI